ncbi:MAG: hypothetical protein Q9220_000772 [cf. Caloplaca sp. 1 TL-2023]
MVQVAGVGHHEASLGDRKPDILHSWEKTLYAELLVYSIAIPLPRLVLLLFYLRIFPNPSFKIAVYAVGSFIIAWCPAVFFTALFQCNPVAFAWDKSIAGGTCINVLAFFRYIAVPIVVSDMALLLLPLPMIWRLRITLRQKLALLGVFFLGSFGLVASIIRMVIFFQRNAFVDATWTSVSLLIWTTFEVDAVLIATSLPPLRPLFLHFWQSRTRFMAKVSRFSASNQSDSSQKGNVPKNAFARLDNVGAMRLGSEVELMHLGSPQLKNDRARTFV